MPSVGGAPVGNGRGSERARIVVHLAVGIHNFILREITKRRHHLSDARSRAFG